MMRQDRVWMRALLCALPLAVLGGCAGVEDEGTFEVVGESTEAVLTTPPAPGSGNILDSTTYLGPLALEGAVQTYFTTNPQFYSFAVTIPAHSQVQVEVTQLGSSRGLDTSLFLYGPKDASGSYGTTPVALDDDDGYGELSRIKLASLEAGGEYLAVVGADAGAGKQFRLQPRCVGWSCLPANVGPAPSNAPNIWVEEAIAPHIETLLAGVWRDGADADMTRYDFGWQYTGQASLDHAAQLVLKQGHYWRYKYDPQPDVYDAAGLNQALASIYRPVVAELLNTYSNGTESVQAKRYYRTYQTGPNGDHWDSLFVILLPESHKIIVFEQMLYEI
ncbi:hypothetical protein [Chondromyces crocatus]|uniref:Peptidase C-terminal archaeal/bacterial domain-containing protein n=1 Tax=Chondromyces crocatus TaxID=52 RepID=A0A0K1ED58_CHOCO|nr:hypothetical protein [Chondromyces crocatus]AKT38612.1 uncharacterized protein CMC5_027590 [Chondromyces crocatus]